VVATLCIAEHGVVIKTQYANSRTIYMHSFQSKHKRIVNCRLSSVPSGGAEIALRRQ